MTLIRSTIRKSYIHCKNIYVNDRTVLLGVTCQRRSLSPLHSEMEGLLWAMSTIVEEILDCQDFETDCSELATIT